MYTTISSTTTVRRGGVKATTQQDKEGSLSVSDKITLGTAIGIGIPSIILALLGVWVAKKRANRKSDGGSLK